MIPVRPRRLPVDLVIRRSFAFAWESRAVLAGPYMIYAIITILADLIGVLALRQGASLPALFITGAEEVFAMAFAVGIHRFVLLADAPAGFRFFRFDRDFVQYVVTSVLLFVVTVMASMPALLAVTGQSSDGVPAIVGLVILVVAVMAIGRLSMMLPAAAIGQRPQLRQLWEATRGNGFRILVVIVTTLLPFLAIEASLLRLPTSDQPANHSLAGDLAVTIAAGVVSPLQLIVVTIMLSLCYDALVRGGGPAAHR